MYVLAARPGAVCACPATPWPQLMVQKKALPRDCLEIA